MTSSRGRIGRIFREESGRSVAALIATFGDLDLAEDAVQEAFAVAVRRWPEDGIPPNPGAWITPTARNRAIDRLRRDARGRELLRAAAPPSGWKGDPATEGEPVSDDRLRLISTRLPTPPSPAECRIAIPQNAEEPLNGERSMPSASNFYKASVPAIVANGYLTWSQGQ